MVQEVRDIMLSMDEVRTAFVSFQNIAPDFLPRCDIISCRTATETVILTVEMAYGSTKQQSELTFKGIDVLRPLIRFCIENNIKLPRDGQKSLIYKADKIIMHIELDLKIDVPMAIAMPVDPNQIKHLQHVIAENLKREEAVKTAPAHT